MIGTGTVNDGAAPRGEHTGSCERLRAGYKVAVLCGGNVTSETRDDVAQGRRAKIDVLEMERRWGADIYDFSVFQDSTNKRARRFLQLAERTRCWSWCLVLYALPKLRHCDLIYATGEDIAVPLALLLRLRNILRPQVVMRLEQPVYGKTWWRRTVFSGMLSAALKRISCIFCRTRAHRNYLSEGMKIPYRRLVHLTEPVDPDFTQPGESVGDVDLPVRTRPRIVTAGLEMRDYGTLSEAVASLDVEVVICAGSPWSHFTFGDDQKRSLPPNILVKRFAPSQMRSVYATADLVVIPVLPTLRACGTNVILEAWCMEKPVIVTKTAGLMEQIIPEETGLFAEPLDISDLRYKIQWLLDRPLEAAHLGRNGREKAISSHHIDDFIETIARHSLGYLEERNSPCDIELK